MARSKHDTLIYATILLAPMVTAVGYIAMTPTEVVVVSERTEPVATIEPMAPTEPIEPFMPCTPRTTAPPPAPVLDSPPVVEPVPVPEASRPDPPRASAALPTTPGAGMLVHEGQLVLVTDPDIAWSKGRLRSPALDYTFIATKAVDASKLPAELAPLVNTRVIVYAADGSACTATTGAMTIYGRQDGELMYHREDPDEVDGEGNLTAAGLLAVRKDVFAEAQLLLARQSRISDEGPQHRCEGVWARRADLPAPTVFGLRTLDDDSAGALTAQVLAVIEDLPEIVSLRAAYEADRATRTDIDEVPEWPAYRDDALVVTRWDEIGGARSFVNVEVGDGGDACSSDFWEKRALLFALRGAELVQQPGGGFFAPLALLDLERDGVLEAVLDGGKLLRSQDESAVQSYDFPYHGCSC